MADFPNYRYDTGLGNVGSYQTSGKPFVTGTLNAHIMAGGVHKVSFPSVTRWIYVTNHSTTDTCRIGFSEHGVADGTNFFRLGPTLNPSAAPSSQRLELKVTELYLSGSNSVDVVAGLTGISNSRIANISPSGSNWSGSAGIG